MEIIAINDTHGLHEDIDICPSFNIFYYGYYLKGIIPTTKNNVENI